MRCGVYERFEIKIVDIEKLKVHEKINPKRLAGIMKEIRNKNRVHPLIAEKDNLILLDGHHRMRALQLAGIKRAPVVLVDYNDASIEVESWKGANVRKRDVMFCALSGKVMPEKTTKHMIRVNCEKRHISVLSEGMQVDIKTLGKVKE